MYANTTLVSLCQCFETNTKTNSDLCLLKFVPSAVKMEMRRHVPERSRKDINCNQFNGTKHKKSIKARLEEIKAIKTKFPTKIPIIVSRYSKETTLPILDKSKFLVPEDITISQFVTVIRNRMRLRSVQTLYLLINNRSIFSNSATFATVYAEHAAKDGFLYVTYASQEAFGGDCVCLLA